MFIGLFIGGCGCEPMKFSVREPGLAYSIETDPASMAAFQQTVYPMVRQHCASCHGATQSPLFAVSNPLAAHADLVRSGKVNFGALGNSRIVLRLSEDQHNCWKDCSQAAGEMTAALQKWSESRSVAVTLPVVTGTQTIPANLGTTGVVLSFPLRGLTEPSLGTATFEITVVKFDNFSYRFFSPRLRAPANTQVYTKGIHILLNQVDSPGASTYRAVDTIAITGANSYQYSNASLIHEIARGPGNDTVAIGFEALSPGASGAQPEQRFQTARNLLQTQCIGCHTGGNAGRPTFSGLNTEADWKAYRWEGAPVVVAGSADSSMLYRVVSGAANPAMPPNASLTQRTPLAETLKLWINGLK